MVGGRLRLTPRELAAAARASGLDFIAITEHNTADTHGAWGALANDDLLLPGTGLSVTEWRTSAAESAFVRVEVRHLGQQMAALSNPVILG
jgi:hypothetical protein